MNEQASAAGESSPAQAQRVKSGDLPNGKEIEVKFRTGPEGLNRALSLPVIMSASAPQAQKLRTVYFDTPAGDLRKNGIVLRVRKKGRAAPVLGFKRACTASGGPFRREEVEVRSPDFQPNLALFDAALSSELAGIIGDKPIEPRFETQIKRRTVLVDHSQSRIEVAFDEGYIASGERRVPLTEVELELKSGYEPDLYDLATRLAAELPLSLDFVSKAENGFRVTIQEKPLPVKAVAIEFGSGATLDDAVTAVVSNTLAQFVANWAALRETDHPESVHQMRVALRRMRSGLAMFKRVLPCPELNVLRAEARRIASALGPARECDVFRQSAEKGPLLHPDRPASCGNLLAEIEERRIAAYKDARALIDNPATSIFVLQVQRFLANRAWRGVLSGAELTALTMPAAQFAHDALDKLKARVMKRGKGFPDITDEARHELRIALKNLRYGAEFFGGLFDRGRKAKSYAGGISALQDILGSHNDMVSARQFLREISAAAGPAAEKGSGFMLGWHARGTAIADAELRGFWKAFRRADSFWK